MNSSDSELNESDIELQEALAEGRLKPGINLPEEAPKEYINNIPGLKQKLTELELKLPWIERLDCMNEPAPLAPELALQLHITEQKRENQLKNNKKLPQFAPSEDPVLNDFKRETMFYRQAQATVLETIPKLKLLNIPTKRPDDYFAEMAKSDEHMQKIRQHLMQKEQQQQRSERVKQLRQQRKEGKLLQIQQKLERQKEKKAMLEQVKKVRKGQSNDLDFLDGKKNNNNNKSKKSIEKRKVRDKKFGFGGKKRGQKQNTRESTADFSEYGQKSKNRVKGGKVAKKRPGKNRRANSRAKSRK